jgi:hypothetical protein
MKLNPSSMTENNQNSSNPQQPSAGYGNVPQNAESYGNIPHSSALFGNVRQPAERSENHTVSVREAARLFEAAGVARIERSIVNWCHPNRHGVARLDCFFDENERKYYITPQSIDRAIGEEQAKLDRREEPLPQPAEPREETRPSAEHENKMGSTGATEGTPDRVRQLEKEVLDLRILEAGKDFWIKQLREERDGFVTQLVEGSRRIGKLETELRQLTAGNQNSAPQLPLGSEVTSDAPSN